MAKKPLSRDSKPTQAATQENQQQPTGQTGHTPGPWEWDLRPGTHSVSLMSRRFLVMDFVRWGMGSAAPRFRDVRNLMFRVEHFSAPIPGFEHHEWDKLVVHPDAYLIAAAPDLLAACEALIAYDEAAYADDSAKSPEYLAARDAARKAIAKAEGRQ